QHFATENSPRHLRRPVSLMIKVLNRVIKPRRSLEAASEALPVVRAKFPTPGAHRALQHATQNASMAPNRRIRDARSRVRPVHVPLHQAMVTRISFRQMLRPGVMGPVTVTVARQAVPTIGRVFPVLRSPTGRFVAAAAVGCIALAAAGSQGF